MGTISTFELVLVILYFAVITICTIIAVREKIREIQQERDLATEEKKVEATEASVLR